MASEPTASTPRSEPIASPSVGTSTPAGINQWLYDHRTRPLPRASVREEVDVAVQARTSELEREISNLRQELDRLRDSEAQLRLAAAQATDTRDARTAMLGALARELRVPLNAIVGFAQRLGGAALTSAESELLKNVSQNSQWLLRLTDDLLDFAQVETGDVSLVPIDFEFASAVQVAVDLHADSAARKGVSVLVEIDPNVPTRVRGDRKRLQHVLVKLIGHAIKFTDQRQVVVHAWTEQAKVGQWRVRFEVGDAGTTVPVAVQSTLFDPDPPKNGSSVHLVGTRLGLAVTKRLVQLMGGRIGLLSRPGAPSTFWFTVELGEPLDPRLAPPRPTTIAGRHILLVDDNPANLRLFGRLANVWKIRAGLVESADAALAYVAQAARTSSPVELVLLEHSATSADALALADALRREHSGRGPAIGLLTSRFDSLTPEELSAHGIAACETKPIRPRTLRAMLTRALPAAPCAVPAAMPGAA